MVCTVWEDYGTGSEFIEAMCNKFFLFRLITCYSPVIYVAFGKVICTQAYLGQCYHSDCLLELNWLLLSLFFLQFSFKIVEILWLYLTHTLSLRQMQQEIGSNSPSYEQEKYLSSQVISYSIYSDLVMNYGYVVLFATGCPLVALLVTVLTAVQAMLDAWRLSVFTRRPGPMSYSSWAGANDLINLLAVLGAIMNPGIVLFSSPYFSDLTGENKLFLFIAVEHGLLFLKIIIEYAISDEAESKLHTVVRRGKQWCDLKEMELCAKLSKQDNSPTLPKSCALQDLELLEDSRF